MREGGAVMGADQWHTQGLTGKGVKVGVIDMGFKDYSMLLGTELPASVTTKVAGSYSEFSMDEHGAACAEIVHDTAPDAELFLANAGDWDVDFHNAVEWLASQEVDVISSSIGINYNLISGLFSNNRFSKR